MSLAGRLLKPIVDRFVVQWPQLKYETERDNPKVVLNQKMVRC